ncbi:MAG TPA: glycosyltransferase family 4 protein [Bryobacteraceae bacterium]|nr:glycosyltransferase family 4 protein [Bryobacteraceae bacterium]
MKIHFLVVKDLQKGGGVEAYTRGVGRLLARRGHEVTVYATGQRGDSPSVVDGMEVIWLPRLRPHWAEKFGGAVMATCMELAKQRPDVIHLHSVAAGAMAPLLTMRNVPCVIQMHGLEWMRSRWGNAAKGVLKAMERCSVSWGDALTAVSHTQCDYFNREYGAACEYIPTAVEIREPRAPRLLLQHGLSPRNYVLFAARLVPEKGAHYLIPAFRELKTDCSLVIAGDGSQSPAYTSHLKELANGDPRIRFTGDVRGELLEELLSNARVFVQPSELEGLSIGLIEAMSYGLPCVASDIPENLEAVGDAALRFRSKSIEDLRIVLDDTLHDPVLVKELAVQARRRVESRFTWDLVTDQLEDLYSRLLAGWRPHRTGQAWEHPAPTPKEHSTTATR